MSRKGQAALEFMMTYGWAILVVLAAIGALSYFGILNPTMLTPDTCLATSGFGCAGKPVIDGTAGTIAFTVVNGMGSSVTLDNAGLDLSDSLDNAQIGCDPLTTYICTRGDIACTDDSLLVQDGASATIVVTGCDLSNTNVIRGELAFTFTNPDSNLPDVITFKVGGKVRQP